MSAYRIERSDHMRYFLIDINNGKSLGNVIVKATTIEEALRIANETNEER